MCHASFVLIVIELSYKTVDRRGEIEVTRSNGGRLQKRKKKIHNVVEFQKKVRPYNLSIALRTVQMKGLGTCRQNAPTATRTMSIAWQTRSMMPGKCHSRVLRSQVSGSSRRNGPVTPECTTRGWPKQQNEWNHVKGAGLLFFIADCPHWVLYTTAFFMMEKRNMRTYFSSLNDTYRNMKVLWVQYYHHVTPVHEFVA